MPQHTYDVRDSATVQPVSDVVLAASATFVDTSPMCGAAERVLARSGPGEAIVATKVWTGSAREGREQIRRALEWYGGTNDVYQIYTLGTWGTHLPYLEELLAARGIRVIGITHYSASAFDRTAEIGETGRVSVIPVPYNPREREAKRALPPLAAARELIAALATR